MMEGQRHIILLSGVSGAGKSTISHVFEELGYRLIENVPNVVLPALCAEFESNPAYELTVIIVEIRHAKHAIEILRSFKGLKSHFVLLDCNKAELLTRYRLTRHVHPLQAKGYPLEECLQMDEQSMKEVRPLADVYVDTTGLSTNELRHFSLAHFGKAGDKMVITFSSFGYKYGIPQDAEVIFDCRNVPNPFWVKELKTKTGLDPEVRQWLDNRPECDVLFTHMVNYLDYFLSSAHVDGRNYVNIDLGCSGGQHRSVYFAQRLYEHYKDQYLCFVSHREMSRYMGVKK